VAESSGHAAADHPGLRSRRIPSLSVFPADLTSTIVQHDGQCNSWQTVPDTQDRPDAHPAVQRLIQGLDYAQLTSHALIALTPIFGIGDSRQLKLRRDFGDIPSFSSSSLIVE
jgi:hypothetical protein